MKTSLAVFLLMAFMAATGSAAPFSPSPLKLTAPSYLLQNYSTGDVTIPFTVSGTPATVILAVITGDKWGMASGCHNGWLGWHYMQLVDTCVYVSPPSSFGTGTQTISWDSKDMEENPVYAYNYTYYLLGWDSGSPGVKATDFISPKRFDRAYIQSYGQDGRPLANPFIFDALPFPATSSGSISIIRNKWELGYDPEDPSLLETTTYRSKGEFSRLAPNPINLNQFFTQELRPEGTLVLLKRQWVPNGESYLNTDWGDNGETAIPTLYSTEWPFLPTGPVSDGNSFYFINSWRGDDGPRTGIVRFDPIMGTEEDVIDLTRWWRESSGAVSGPADLEFRESKNGAFIFCSSPVSCINMMVSPQAEEGTDPVRWVNGNGDFFADRNYLPDSRNPWACTDTDHSDDSHMLSVDSNLFSAFPGDAENSSFGIFAPDGRGIGTIALPGINEGTLQALRFLDYGSSYDGLYVGGTDHTGIRYIAFDSVRGNIEMSSGFEIAYVHVLAPYEKETLRAGSARTIIWDFGECSVMYKTAAGRNIFIDFSSDNGLTWSPVADSLETTQKKYVWTAPDVNSSQCRIRIVNREYPSIRGESGTFTISGASGVAEENHPKAFAVSNYPNPFNPSTTISFTLPASGQARMTVYDITGRKVRELLSGSLPAGAHTAVWDGKDARGIAVSSGVYIARLNAGKFTATGKMLLVR